MPCPMGLDTMAIWCVAVLSEESARRRRKKGQMMEKYCGQAVLQKLAVGKIYFYEKQERAGTGEQAADTQAELVRFEAAKKAAAEHFQALYEKTKKETGEAEASIFEVYQMILEDEGYLRLIRDGISQQRLRAQRAVEAAGEACAARFEKLKDEYMKARAADIRAISGEMADILCKRENGMRELLEPVILVAEDLTPAETVRLDKSKLLGIVTEQGSLHSHTAILARSMDIPALIGVPVQKSWDGQPAILDGCAGELILQPDLAQLECAHQKIKEYEETRTFAEQAEGKIFVAEGGKEPALYANIGSVREAQEALQNGAEGIGLFRSEYLYLEAGRLPTEEEQFAIYRAVVQAMAPRRVVIRTLDIGADKQVEGLGVKKEENPALGLRGIRLCLTRREVFCTQLRALLRAGAYGNLAIMFPMIISVQEIREAKAILEAVREELAQEGIAYGDVELGVMIETPAAALQAGELAREVSFFSIGTNDLTQYTLALDRGNAALGRFFDAHHPAVMKLIRHTIEEGHKAGIRVSICGELAADPALTKTFLELGVDALSVPPAGLMSLRRRIRGM